MLDSRRLSPDAPKLMRPCAISKILPRARNCRFGPHTVTRAEIVAFAAEFDPQPFHLDEAAAADTLLGGLAASGWHTCALFMRMLYDGWLNDAASMGSPGVDSLKWLRPVRPGDVLSGRSIVLEVRASKSRPDRGFVSFRHEVVNARGEPVMLLENPIMLRRRPCMTFFEDIAVGERDEIGAHTFTAEEIKRFAFAFDPQPFHLDEAAAEASHFGGLCASGWHTLAVWMKLNVRALQQLRERARGGRRAARAARPLPRLRRAEMAEAGLCRRHESASPTR